MTTTPGTTAAWNTPPPTDLAHGRVEEREVVVVGELSAGRDVLVGEERHPMQAVHLPFLHLAVGRARVVHEPTWPIAEGWLWLRFWWTQHGLKAGLHVYAFQF